MTTVGGDSISAPVGIGQPNTPEDVRRVQHLLNRNLTASGTEGHLAEDGIFGPKTQARLVDYQRDTAHLRQPDGVVDPAGPTMRALTGRHEAAASHDYTAHASADEPVGVRARVAAHPAQQHESTSTADWISRALPAAQSVKETWGVPISVTIAQGAIESNWGKKHPGNEYFGVKGHALDGKSVMVTTHEESGGKLHSEKDAFRSYSSLEQSADDYGRFLTTNKRFAAAFEHKDDAHRFVHEVAKAHYATDSSYERKVTSIIDHHDLTRFDTAEGQRLAAVTTTKSAMGNEDIAKALWANASKAPLPSASSEQDFAKAWWRGQTGLPQGSQQEASVTQTSTQSSRLKM